ncbi:MAG: hypothetical protein ABI589_07125 [Burkholderiales bacterium]
MTDVQAGTLVAANPAALGSSAAETTVASGATLSIANVAMANEPVSISGNGVGGAGALTGGGAAALAGDLTLAAPSRIGTTSAGSSLTITGAVNAPAQPLSIAGPGDVSAANLANDFSTFSIAGARNVALRDWNAI